MGYKTQQIRKIFQSSFYWLMSKKWGPVLLVFVGFITLNTILHIVDDFLDISFAPKMTMYETEKEKFFRMYTDNIAKKDFRNDLTYPAIDIVYTWVNGSDPLQQELLQYYFQLLHPDDLDDNTTMMLNGNSSFSGNSSNTTDELEEKEKVNQRRYRDNNELLYSLRSVEKFAGWVRNIYIVTNGQIPNWLNVYHPKIHIVSHEEIFLNESHLPVFSSPAIECNIHRIPGLSDKFIYLNDDVMFGDYVYPEDFYSISKGQYVFLSWDVPQCNPGCAASWIGDGYCDTACNVSQCHWDGGDCIGVTSTTSYSSSYWSQQQRDRVSKQCSQQCPNNWVGDRFCDRPCNNLECGFDAGDCGTEDMENKLIHLDLKRNTQRVIVANNTKAMYFNISKIFPDGWRATSGSHNNSQFIRTSTISQKHKLLTLTFLWDSVNNTEIAHFEVEGEHTASKTIRTLNFILEYILVESGDTFTYDEILDEEAEIDFSEEDQIIEQQKEQEKNVLDDINIEETEVIEEEEIEEEPEEEKEENVLEDLVEVVEENMKIVEELGSDHLKEVLRTLLSEILEEKEMQDKKVEDELENEASILSGDDEEDDDEEEPFLKEEIFNNDNFFSTIEPKTDENDQVLNKYTEKTDDLSDISMEELLEKLHSKNLGTKKKGNNNNAVKLTTKTIKSGGGIPSRNLLELFLEEKEEEKKQNWGKKKPFDENSEFSIFKKKINVVEHDDKIKTSLRSDYYEKMKKLERTKFLSETKNKLEEHRDSFQRSQFLSMKRKESQMGATGITGRELFDTFGDSLIHVNSLLDEEYGRAARKVPAHMPHFIDKNVFQELYEKWSGYYNATTSNRFRASNDMQYTFGYMYYLMSEGIKYDTDNFFNDLDRNGNGILDKYEIIHLGSMLKKKKVNSEELKSFFKNVTNITWVSSKTMQEELERKDENELNQTLLDEVNNSTSFNFSDVLNRIWSSTPSYTPSYDISERDKTMLFSEILSDLLQFAVKVDLNKISRHSEDFSTYVNALYKKEINETYLYQNFTKTAFIESGLDYYVSGYFNNTKGKYKYELKDLSDIGFFMIRDSEDTVFDNLESLRIDRKKFICLNDDMNETHPNPLVLEELHNYLEWYYPEPSQFEHPYGIINPFYYKKDFINFEKRSKLRKSVSILIGSVLLVCCVCCVFMTIIIYGINKKRKAKKIISKILPRFVNFKKQKDVYKLV